MKNWLAKSKSMLAAIRDFLDEKALATAHSAQLSRLHKFAHFWLLVARSFSRNRCPIRAAALAYTTLLALIPMLVVVLSVSSSLFKDEGEQRINQLIDRFVANITSPEAATSEADSEEFMDEAAFNAGSDPAYVKARKNVAATIQSLIANARNARLGALATVLLIIAAISMLSRIEDTFNDIWGVSQGRSWFARIVQYWAVITLGPLLLIAALGLASGPHFKATQEFISHTPVIGSLLFQILPVVVLCLTFSLFYVLMPNTKVQFRAALAGGLIAGVLWHLNNYLNVLYVSRVVSNSKLYGHLAMIPVIMIGLYLSWAFLLFGAQVAYAYQNRAAYLEDKIAENINQRGREFIALRLMQCVGQRFLHGERPATVPEMADALIVPTRLVQQIMQALLTARLVVEVVIEALGRETAYSPARPIETINCHDVLLALRAGKGQELPTRDDSARVEVYGEFEKILEAERKAASNVTILAMVHRADELAALASHKRKAVSEGKA